MQLATPRKVGKRWRIEKQVDGRKLSSYHDTKQAAINWSIEQEVVHTGRDYIKGRTMAMLFERYGREIVAGRKGERWDNVRLKTFAKQFGHIPVESFREIDIERWRDDRLLTVQASTFNRELNLLSAVLSKAVRWRWRADNPVANVDRPQDPPHRDRLISPSERLTLVEAMGLDMDSLLVETRHQELAIVFLVAIESAMRLGEIVTLRWEHVYLDRQFATLPETKNGTKRDVPLSKAAVLYLTAMGPQPDGKVFGIGRDVASNYFRDIRRSVGLDDIVFHDTRHTAITNMARSLTPLELARAVGHKKLDMTLRYFNAHASDLASRLG